MKKVLALIIFYTIALKIYAQVDTSYLYKASTPYGSLDIRVAKSASQYYYLQENKTISYRESAPGVRTDKHLNFLSWNTSEYTEGNLREKSGSNDYFIMNYRLLFPMNYNENYSPGYPIIVVLHGLGERGNCWDDKCYHGDRNWNYNSNNPPAPTNPDNLLLNNELNIINGGGVHLSARNLAGSKLPDAKGLSDRAFPGFVIFPQNLNGWSPNSAQDLIKIVRLLLKKYSIDEDRIYIHGLSNGGSGTFEVLKRAPWLFACALAMSPLSDAYINSLGLAPSIAHIPLWIFQGGKDKSPTPLQTEKSVKGFRDAGAVVRYYLYPNLGHGTWNTAYKEPDFFSWMLATKKSDIHVYADNTAICLSTDEGVMLALAEGFYKYQWQKDGVTIEGATTSFYTAKAAGKYSARFSRFQNPSESQWNQWSEPVTITEDKFIPQARIEQMGTVILPDLNGINEAHLNAVGTFPHYYWYKNNNLVDFGGDTLNYVTVKSSKGNGLYTLVTAEYSKCPSQSSEGKYIFFSNSAPLNINAPEDFKGEAFSGGVKLNWTDASTNESGFEIWRRKLLANASYMLWELRVITNSDITTYTDKELEPLSTYQYKIRAVSSSGRSNYMPLENNKYLEVTTVEDKTKPSAPASLQAKMVGVNAVELTWQASTDDSDIIKRYHIYFDSGEPIATDTAQLSLRLDNLAVNKTYNFTVRAEDPGGNLSDASNTATVNTYTSGLYYEHSTGAWSKLDDVDWSLAEFSGYIHNFSLAPKTQDDYFNFKFDGYLNIVDSGTYQFSTTSNDGSRLVLDNIVVVNNDGIHDSKEVVSEEMILTTGPKRITVTYFDFTGVDTLVVQYKGPDTGNEWIPIPDGALKSGELTTSGSVSLKAYPNPTGYGVINLVVQPLGNSPLYVNMIDNLGRTVFERQINTDEFWRGIKITPENLSTGLYLIKVKQNNSSGQCKVVIGN